MLIIGQFKGEVFFFSIFIVFTVILKTELCTIRK